MLVRIEHVVLFKEANHLFADDALAKFDEVGGQRDWSIVGCYRSAALLIDGCNALRAEHISNVRCIKGHLP